MKETTRVLEWMGTVARDRGDKEGARRYLKQQQVICEQHGIASAGLPPRDPALGILLREAGVEVPERTRVSERHRLLLLAQPSLADAYEVPPEVLVAAGLATGPEAVTAGFPEAEAPPADIEDAD